MLYHDGEVRVIDFPQAIDARFNPNALELLERVAETPSAMQPLQWAVIIVAFLAAPISPASTLVFAAAMGMLWLGTAPLVSGLIGHIFGLRYVATLSGIAFFSHQAGSFVGAWGGGLIFDAMGSYDQAWKIGVAIGLGTGGETNAPLARAVVGGLSVSTVLTLFLIPTMYVILEERIRRKPNETQENQGLPPAGVAGETN